MKSRWVAASVFVAMALACGEVYAQRSIGTEQEIVGAPRVDMRRQGSEEIVSNRREIEASSEMVFVTTRGPMAGVPQLYFTDLGLWRVHAAVTPVSGLRLTATGTFLPKQPATLDEPFWQTAALGARLGLTNWLAAGLDGEFGKLMADLGYHGSAALTAQARVRMNRYTMWEARLGAIGTRLWPTQSNDTSIWFVETAAAGEFQLCWNACSDHNGATWLGIDVGVPVYHHPGDATAMDPIPIDPRTRLGLTVGSFFAVNETWDFYGTLSWIDRGDPDVPSTQLPIIDGGFDQVQLAFGLIAHWWLKPRSTVMTPVVPP